MKSFPSGILRRFCCPAVQNTFKSTGVDFVCRKYRFMSANLQYTTTEQWVCTNGPPVTTPTLPVSRFNSSAVVASIKLPFSKYYSTHTHTHTSATWLVLDSSEMLRRFREAWGSVVRGGRGVDAGRAAGGMSSATVINAIFSAILSYSQTRGDGGISEG